MSNELSECYCFCYTDYCLSGSIDLDSSNASFKLCLGQASNSTVARTALSVRNISEFFEFAYKSAIVNF